MICESKRKVLEERLGEMENAARQVLIESKEKRQHVEQANKLLYEKVCIFIYIFKSIER